MTALRKHTQGAAAILGIAAAATAIAGPLDPPPGPPAPTQKTLRQIEPRIPIETLPVVINGSGSFYLTGDLTGVSGANGIVINTSNVTIDLNGFSLIGVPGSGDGVVVNGTRDNITVINGTIRNWGFDGLDLFNSRECRVERIDAFSNNGEGIVLGFSGVASDCHTRDNSTIGIQARRGCTIRACTATSNGIAGIVAEDTTVISDCTSRLNGFAVLRATTEPGGDEIASFDTQEGRGVLGVGCGIYAGPNSVITGCVATRNVSYGVQTAEGCVVASTTVADNSQSGVMTSEGCALRAITARSNVEPGSLNQFDDPFGGVVTGRACVVSESAAYANIGAGISVGEASVVDRSSASENGRLVDDAPMLQRGFNRFEEYRNISGIAADNGSVVHSSKATANDGAGIVVNRHAVILASTASDGFGSTSLVDRGSNRGYGFILDIESLIQNSAASRNRFRGFETNNGASVMSSIATDNGDIGFSIGNDSYVRGNNASGNGTVPILRGGNDIAAYNIGANARVEENHAANHINSFVIGGNGFVFSNSAMSQSGSAYIIGMNSIFGVDSFAANLLPWENFQR